MISNDAVADLARKQFHEIFKRSILLPAGQTVD
jgi:hypothetical protein